MPKLVATANEQLRLLAPFVDGGSITAPLRLGADLPVDVPSGEMSPSRLWSEMQPDVFDGLHLGAPA